MSEMTYRQAGDYQIPDIELKNSEEKPLGKYGRMRRAYLEENNPMLLNDLILSEELFPHLQEIDETAHRRVGQLMNELLEKNPAPDKATQQMAWVQHMNSRKAQAEEIVDVYKRQYLGYPYVWGGSSPSTSFDCSGFVSWVINNCGNGWSVGRQTADGLKNLCDIIPPSEAKPGDLIFFQGTYNTSGASHVGIYVGDGMMIHCGDPISYASIETSYWQQHFYCYGRIP